ncbi:uncharacterized protein LY79DRAFT_289064 [Colletotrichum navitas]|uniref:Uncharacterized protein n=1 Tax=Colletotrichum navitas TaxID=681940 RepID=A0AAD8V2J7_9PEZI|nr:uncharacterized protein LY79DRAFT_289064 [Colletotrichum navitas]KAK1584828.1 hypothetical protein LY79DRAFT_289064 [Colletotrichum navitas]
MRIRCRSVRGRGSARVTTREADLSVCFFVSTPATDNIQPTTLEGRRVRRARQGSCHCDTCSDSDGRRKANEALQPGQCKLLGYHKAMHCGQKGDARRDVCLAWFGTRVSRREREPTAQWLPDLVSSWRDELVTNLPCLVLSAAGIPIHAFVVAHLRCL